MRVAVREEQNIQNTLDPNWSQKIESIHPSTDDLDAFVDGESTSMDIVELETHVANCDVCSNYLGGIESTEMSLAGKLKSALASTVGKLVGDSASDLQSGRRSSAAFEASLLPTGKRLGRYRIERLLGHGGMGVVYLAFDERLGRKVALKIPRFDVGKIEQMIARFEREARAMALVTHRHLCPVYDVDFIDGHHLLAMAYVDGESLAHRLARGDQFDSVQIADMTMKLALGLEKAHRARVIHRDLKPANIMIDREGEPILMDFGLARSINDLAATVTHSGTLIGTPVYMAPEQVDEALGPVGPWSDQYSLGAVLYELLSGQKIHSGTVSRVLSRLTTGKPPVKPCSLRPNVNADLERICLKAVSFSVADRYSSIGEMAEALRVCLATLVGTKVRETSAFYQTSLVNSAPKPDSSANDSRTESSLGEFAATKIVTIGRRSSFSGMGIVLGGAFLLVTLLAAIIVIQTGKSEFTIETDSTQIAQRLDSDGGIVVEDRQTNRSFHLKRGENRLPNGDYELTVTTPDGLEFATPQFKLKRFGSVTAVVRAKLLSPDGIGQQLDAKPNSKGEADNLIDQPVSANDVPDPASLDDSLPWGWVDNAEIPAPTNLGPTINTPQNDENAAISADGRILIFNRTGNGHLELWEARRDGVSVVFDPPTRLTDVINVTGFDHDGPFLSADGLRLWFASDRPGTVGSRDLWVSQRRSLDDSWQDPTNLGPDINTDQFEQTPFVTEDRLTLLFSRRVRGLFQILQSDRKSDQAEFGPAKILANINNGVCSSFPRLTPDRLTLIYVHCADKHQKLKLCYSTRPSVDSPFTPPRELSPTINDAEVSGPSLSADGRTLYYASQRPGGLGRFDLWSISNRR